jgi:prephenate dehydratase
MNQRAISGVGDGVGAGRGDAGAAPSVEERGDTGGAAPSIAFLGPAGTFSEEAIFSQADYVSASVRPYPTLEDVLDAVGDGDVDLGFVPIENSIEGIVSATVDSLVFDTDLLIQREVVVDVHLNLVAAPGTTMEMIRTLVSFPFAAGQCRKFLKQSLPSVAVVPANSTAEAARQVSESRRADTAALAPRLAAQLYGLDVLAAAVEDHPDNQTRFVAVARQGVPRPTGHDKTSIVCFQREDRPGSLHAILSEFAARSINLTRLESRPTKRGLGDYCFVIDLEGHVADEVVADCLRVLHAELAGVKFLGSYPAAGDHGPAVRQQAHAAWREAEAWLDAIRGQIT